MKIFQSLVVAVSLMVLLCLPFTRAGMTKEEKRDMIKSMAEECRKSEGASEEEVEKMVNKEYPETKEGMCMVHCLQEQFGITQDGEYQIETVKNLAGMFAGDDENKKKAAEEVAEACKNENDADKCKKAIKISKCIEKEGKARGLEHE